MASTPELVINSLKHGFPDGAGGRIDVSYLCEGLTWTFSVSDTGVGMPKVRSMAIAGLGISTVQALASQLGATVEVKKGGPGIRVEIIHADPPRDSSFALRLSSAFGRSLVFPRQAP